MREKLADRIKLREESVRTRMLNIASKLDDVIAMLTHSLPSFAKRKPKNCQR